MSLRALIYARESKYEARQANRSPEEQVEVGREWCNDHGHTVVEIIIEAGTSASRHARTTRDGWQRAKQLIADREVDVLVTWASNRATRQLGEYVELRDLCATHNVLWCSKGRLLDLSRADDRLTTGLQAVVDDHAVELLREDVHRSLRANARRGRPQGRTLYGYRRVYDTETRALVRQEPHPDQAWLVQTIFAGYLGGHSTNTLTEAIQVASALGSMFGPGIPTSTGVGAWKPGTVRRILANPAYMGRRIYNGADVAEGIWPALVDAGTFERVQRRLELRSVRRNRAAPSARLLSGLALCGVCGSRMTHMPAYRGRGAFYYCSGPGRHVSRMTKALDEFVTVALLRRLADLDAPTEDPAVAVAEARAAELRDELAQARALRRGEVPGRRLSVMAFAEIETDLLPRIEEAERAVRRRRVPLSVDIPPPDRQPVWWTDELSGEQRREIASALIVAVVVDPVGRGNRAYRVGDHTSIEWRR